MGQTRITLDDAMRLSLLHKQALQALRTTIQQGMAEEITANPALGLASSATDRRAKA